MADIMVIQTRTYDGAKGAAARIFRLVLSCLLALFAAKGMAYGRTAEDNGTGITVTGFRLLETDMDARVNRPEYDWNGNKCAIIKVETTLTGFTFDTGTIAITKSENHIGEIWVYVSPGVRKFNIYHPEYGVCRYDLPVTIETSMVYSMKLSVTGAAGDSFMVTNAKVTSGYLKMHVVPENAIVYIGRTQDYELSSQVVTGGSLSMMLEYGEYFYKVENSLYETETGKIMFSEDTGLVKVKLRPAYNCLSVFSYPDSGADVFINGEYAGKTPLDADRKYPKGKCVIRLVHKDYHQLVTEADLSGDGSRKSLSFTMEPRYAIVTCNCPDSAAEIWVDSEYRGKGEWTGRLSSAMSHTIETRRDGHRTQSVLFSVAEGDTARVSVDAPVPLYAILDITSEPSGAEVSIDGKTVGRTPIVQQVLACEHEMRVSMAGYVYKDMNISLEHNEKRTVDVRLEAIRKEKPDEKKPDPKPETVKSRKWPVPDLTYGFLPDFGWDTFPNFLFFNMFMETRAFRQLYYGMGAGYRFGGNENLFNFLVAEEYMIGGDSDLLCIFSTNLKFRINPMASNEGPLFVEPAFRLNWNIFSGESSSAEFVRIGDGPGTLKCNPVNCTGILSVGVSVHMYTVYLYGGYDITPVFILKDASQHYWDYDTNSEYDYKSDSYKDRISIYGKYNSRFVFGISLQLEFGS